MKRNRTVYDLRDRYGSLALPKTGDILIVLVEIVFISAMQLVAVVRVLVVQGLGLELGLRLVLVLVQILERLGGVGCRR